MTARDREESESLARADNAFLAAELGVIALFLIGLAGASEAQARAAGLLLGGPYTAVFWTLVVGLGIVVPLVDPVAGGEPSHRPYAGSRPCWCCWAGWPSGS